MWQPAPKYSESQSNKSITELIWTYSYMKQPKLAKARLQLLNADLIMLILFKAILQHSTELLTQ